MNFKFLKIAGTFLASASAIFVSAQLTPIDTLTYSTLQVTEKRLPYTSLIDEGKTIQIITSADIQALPVKTINEVLTYVAGIDMDQRGILGAQADLSLQGSSFEQTLLLVNGIPMRDAQTGHHLLNLPVDINQIERIEIAYGAAGRKYGSNALAGAINIVTKKPNSYSSSFETFIGIADPKDNTGNSYNLVGVNTNATWGQKKAQHALGAGVLQTDGYRYNSANKQYKLNYQGRVHINDGNYLDVLGGTFYNQFGANGFYAPPYDKDAIETVHTSYIALQANINTPTWKLRPLAYYRYNTDHYVFIADQPEVYQNFHFGTTAGAELHANRKNKFGELGIGIESRGEVLASNNLGKRSRYYFNLYGEEKFKIGENTSLIAGVNAQYNATTSNFSFFPGLEINQKISENYRAYLNVGTGNRMASYTEMYYVGPSNIGNDSLNNEVARYAEIGFRKSGKIQFNASGFYRQVLNAITYTREIGETVWAPSNFTAVNFTGVQANTSYTVNDKNNLSFNYMYLNASFQLDEGIETKYAFEHARHRLVGQFGHKWTKNFTTVLTGRYVYRYIGTSYNLFDLRLNWQLHENVNLTADITNILDKSYIDSGFVEMPGRWYRVGFRFNLK